MRTAILLLIAQSCFGGYSKCVPVVFTTNTALIPSTQTNFTAMICANGAVSTNCDATAHTNLALGNMKHTGSGGVVTSLFGYDIGIFANRDATGPLSYQLDYYSPTTGAGIWKALIPALSTTPVVTEYLCYGNAAITTNQSTTATWNSNYKMVQPFGNGVTVSVTDATSNANNGTNTSNVTAMTNGQIDGAIHMNLNPTSFAFGNSATVETQDITIEMWVALQFGSNQLLVAKADDITAAGWELSTRGPADPPGIGWAFHDGGGTQGYYTTTVGAIPISPAGPPFPANAVWHHLVFTWTSGTAKFYVDGALTDTIATHSGTINYASDVLRIGNQSQNGSLTGAVDEVRISNTVLTANYVKAAYSNQSAPWTFYAFGTEYSPGGSPGARRLILF